MKTIAVLYVLVVAVVLVSEGKKKVKAKVTTPTPTIPPATCEKDSTAVCSEKSIESEYDCQCPIIGTLMRLRCPKQKIKDAKICPDNILNANVTSIDVQLDHNSIESIDNSILAGFAHLVSNLDLSYNRIDELDDNTFEKFRNLVALDLHNNKISSLDENMFIGLEMLEELDLRNNQISDISGTVFKHLKALRRLYLDGNPLKSIDNRTFHSMSHLEFLTMENCSLQYLHEPWLKGLHSLKTLSLANNSFLVVPNLHGLSSVEKIVLSGNGFTEINDDQFSDLKNLKELWLEKLPDLWLVDSCGFCGLKKLTTLILRNNPKLSRLEEFAFGRDYKHKGLMEVDLRDNLLTSIYPDTLPWGNISELHLQGNPWKCDCQLKWIPTANMKLFEPSFCSEPDTLKEKNLEQLSDNDFNCLTPQAKSRKFRGRLFAGMVALLSIAGLMSVIWFLCYGKVDCRPLHLPWKSSRGPIYAYRNLAMRTEDETTSCGKDEQPLVHKSALPDPVAL